MQCPHVIMCYFSKWNIFPNKIVTVQSPSKSLFIMQDKIYTCSTEHTVLATVPSIMVAQGRPLQLTTEEFSS
uniref:Uncharacterized protein n=1 Tax=Anguilla anguilla TaxID=7936 RepID=A0A0E9WZW9_ANGAN